MKRKSKVFITIIITSLTLFSLFSVMPSSAWARAGGGGSSGSLGSRSFSSPSMPPSSSGQSSPLFGNQNPGYQSPYGQGQPGGFSRSPFLQGMAGGLAGGFLGSLLFGGRGGYGYPMGGGGAGLLDLIILGLLVYFLWKFVKARVGFGGAAYVDRGSSRMEGTYGTYEDNPPYYGGTAQIGSPSYDEVHRGVDQLRSHDPGFDEETFKETVQDIFFRIQAAWMNRSLEGVESMVTSEMAQYFSEQFTAMKQQNIINKLENIAVRKVEPSEVWQENGKDYVTVLFTANLLDYTINDHTDAIVSGSRMDPVKFKEFWTFSRDCGPNRWQLSAINQATQ